MTFFLSTTRASLLSFFLLVMAIVAGVIFMAANGVNFQEEETELDRRVKDFLESHRYSWRDMNVPEADGRILHDLILEHKYTRALELGTSTGHSSIWIAWAMSKTGGKLITIEINEKRYREALANFEEAGLSEFIDARLGDAHQLVKEIEGPFDFIFIDADKDWYVRYAQALIPKLVVGGCLTAHNVYQPRRRGYRRYRWGGGEYYEFMINQPNFETFIHPQSQAGLAISFKKGSIPEAD